MLGVFLDRETADRGDLDLAGLMATLPSWRDYPNTPPEALAGRIAEATEIVTPHTAWASRDARQRLIDQVAGDIRAFLAGEPRNVVS